MHSITDLWDADQFIGLSCHVLYHWYCINLKLKRMSDPYKEEWQGSFAPLQGLESEMRE